MPGQTVLKALLRAKHMQEHKSFCREYNRVARGIDPDLVNGHPSKATFYRWLAGDLRRLPYPGACRVLENMFPGWDAADLFAQWDSTETPQPPQEQCRTVDRPQEGLLTAIPNSISMAALSGYWVTVYKFTELDKIWYHADVSLVVPDSARQATITNYVPPPRSEGHTPGFRNVIEVSLVNRQLMGVWKNANDNYFFGSLHLAVLPGENTIQGFYTGFLNDMDVVTERWKWVRLDPASVRDGNLEEAVLQEPRQVYTLLEGHPHTGGPIKLSAITEMQ